LDTIRYKSFKYLYGSNIDKFSLEDPFITEKYQITSWDCEI